MVLADLGRKITNALHSLSKATVINEDVSCYLLHLTAFYSNKLQFNCNYKYKIFDIIYF